MIHVPIQDNYTEKDVYDAIVDGLQRAKSELEATFGKTQKHSLVYIGEQLANILTPHAVHSNELLVYPPPIGFVADQFVLRRYPYNMEPNYAHVYLYQYAEIVNVMNFKPRNKIKILNERIKKCSSLL